MNSSLSRLGYSPRFEHLYLEKRIELAPSLAIFPARVISESRGRYLLKSPHADFPESAWGELRGSLIHTLTQRSDYPSTGDWVLAEWHPDMSAARIHGVMDRSNALIRRAAGERAEDQVIGANIDYGWITTSLNQDFNIRRIERYLALAWSAGTQPVIVVTKIDLASPDEITRAREQINLVALGVDQHWVSSESGLGITRLLETLKVGETAALIGSSGVGKSTLTNRLLGVEKLATQSIRCNDDRGRHTTTARHLIELPNGALLMDTPGMRELALSEHSSGIATSFSEIETLEQRCRFTDCSHGSEPGCAVQEAIRNGQIDEDRFESHRKLQREAEFEARRGDRAAQSEARKRWKKVGAQARLHMKRKRWDE